MRVSEKITYDEYWSDSRFSCKKPLRNGSLLMMVGDNIYHKNKDTNDWVQEDSHHSNPDGTINVLNLKRDTSSSYVLLSDHFYYFGKSAPIVELSMINYKNHRGYSVRSLSDNGVNEFIAKIERSYKACANLVLDDPFDFSHATKRVDQSTGKLSE